MLQEIMSGTTETGEADATAAGPSGSSSMPRLLQFWTCQELCTKLFCQGHLLVPRGHLVPWVVLWLQGATGGCSFKLLQHAAAPT